jgi:hypothetical protein
MGVFERGSAELKRIAEMGRAAADRARERVLEPLQRAVETGSSIQATRQASLENVGPEPPVVARMVIEIRSDGSRTIARGGLEDLTTGEKVAIRADGTSPAQLARSLASTLVTLPLFAARVARSLKRGDEAKPSPDELRRASGAADET